MTIVKTILSIILISIVCGCSPQQLKEMNIGYYEQGLKARKQNLPYTANPFIGFPNYSKFWLDGWMDMDLKLNESEDYEF